MASKQLNSRQYVANQATANISSHCKETKTIEQWNFFFVAGKRWMIGQVVSVRVYTMKASDFAWSNIILSQLGVRHQNDKARGNRLPLLTRCKKQYLFSVLVCPSNSLESCRIFYLWAMFCGRLQRACWSATSDDGAAHMEHIIYSHVLIW